MVMTTREEIAAGVFAALHSNPKVTDDFFGLYCFADRAKCARDAAEAFLRVLREKVPSE